MSKQQNIAPERKSISRVAETAHELRSPLGGIDAMARLLRSTGTTPEQLRLIDGLLAASGHLRAVADGILDEEESVQPPCEQRLDLRPFLSAFSISAEARAAAKGIGFTLQVDENVPEVLMAEPFRIRQILENLIDNAMKVTRKGGVSLSVSQTDHNGYCHSLRFTIADTGPGFTKTEAASLFQDFGRIANGVVGTGIGLSLVRRLASAMGGEVGCKGRLGEGAVFWFTIQVRCCDAPLSMGAVRDVSLTEADAISGPPQTVLVVDDTPANRMIMAAMLEHFGYRTLEAASAEEGLTLLQQHRVCAVMLDQTLPGISGLEALRIIRATPGRVGSLPVIPVTGRVSKADRAAFAAAGANGFIAKPVTAAAVRHALGDVLKASISRAA